VGRGVRVKVHESPRFFNEPGSLIIARSSARRICSGKREFFEDEASPAIDLIATLIRLRRASGATSAFRYLPAIIVVVPDCSPSPLAVSRIVPDSPGLARTITRHRPLNAFRCGA
jgi:hypothetical protein